MKQTERLSIHSFIPFLYGADVLGLCLLVNEVAWHHYLYHWPNWTHASRQVITREGC